jgi:hypothetical protein
MYWDVTTAVPTPKFSAHLKWANTPIPFDASDCSENIMGVDQLPLVTSPTITIVRMHHVLIDGGAALSVMGLHAF